MPFYILLALLGSIFYTADASAAICVEDNTSDCEGLGYNQSSCAYGGVACPFNTAYWYCASWSCADGRYSSSAIANQDCVEVSYKGLTCYDCQEKEICASGTYETEAECKTATGKSCEQNSEGCYAAISCASGTYETETKCEAATGKSCEKNSGGCYEATSCILGSYKTEEICEIKTERICEENSAGCYKAVACDGDRYETETECEAETNRYCFKGYKGCYEAVDCLAAGTYETEDECGDNCRLNADNCYEAETKTCSEGRYDTMASCVDTTGRTCELSSDDGFLCYEPYACASGTYETETECKTNTKRDCKKLIEGGCYKAMCASGTYETFQECFGCVPSTNCPQAGRGCLINTDGCYEKVSCDNSGYVTQAECLRQRKGKYICTNTGDQLSLSGSGALLKYRCWYANYIGSGGGSGGETCSSYPFTECPEHAFCQSCTVNYGDNVGAIKLKFVVCDYGYYNAGSSTAPNCISCTSAKATISQDKMDDFNEQCQGY